MTRLDLLSTEEIPERYHYLFTGDYLGDRQIFRVWEHNPEVLEATLECLNTLYDGLTPREKEPVRSIPGVLIGRTIGTRDGKSLPSELMETGLGVVFGLVGLLVLGTEFLLVQFRQRSIDSFGELFDPQRERTDVCQKRRVADRARTTRTYASPVGPGPSR